MAALPVEEKADELIQEERAVAKSWVEQLPRGNREQLLMRELLANIVEMRELAEDSLVVDKPGVAAAITTVLGLRSVTARRKVVELASKWQPRLRIAAMEGWSIASRMYASQTKYDGLPEEDLLLLKKTLREIEAETSD